MSGTRMSGTRMSGTGMTGIGDAASRTRRAAWMVLPLFAALQGGVHAPAHAQRPDTAIAAPDSGFFSRETPLTVTIVANFNALRRDRDTNPEWRTGTLRWADSGGSTREVAVRLRPRGVWRRANCDMPPLRLDVPRTRLAGTPFAGINRPKLVNTCRNVNRFEQYILQELQLYRVYHAITPLSFRARLLRITYADSGSEKVRMTRWGFLVEEPEALASRVGGIVPELDAVDGTWLDPRSRTIFGLFQHLIANHDWSVIALHNAEVIARDTSLHPVAYDFDYSGAVNAHYAVPPPLLPIRRVRDRHFRGDCAPRETFAEVVALLQSRHAAIMGLYDDEIGRLLSPSVTRETKAFLQEFFDAVGDSTVLERTVIRQCRPQ